MNKYRKDTDGIEEAYPPSDGVQKVDPSVLITDLYLKGPMKGEVPLERTMRKPDAYYPNKSGPK